MIARYVTQALTALSTNYDKGISTKLKYKLYNNSHSCTQVFPYMHKRHHLESLMTMHCA